MDILALKRQLLINSKCPLILEQGFSAVHLQTRQSAQLHVVLLLRACETCSDAGEDRCAEGTKLWVGLAQDYWTILNPKFGRKDSSVLKSALSTACWSQSQVFETLLWSCGPKIRACQHWPPDSSVLADRDRTTFRYLPIKDGSPWTMNMPINQAAVVTSGMLAYWQGAIASSWAKELSTLGVEGPKWI